MLLIAMKMITQEILERRELYQSIKMSLIFLLIKRRVSPKFPLLFLMINQDMWTSFISNHSLLRRRRKRRGGGRGARRKKNGYQPGLSIFLPPTFILTVVSLKKKVKFIALIIILMIRP